jgi:hypothetical protein
VTVKPSGSAFEVVGIDEGGIVAAYNRVSANKMLVTDLITAVNFRREIKDDASGGAGARTRQEKMTELLEESNAAIISFKPNPRAKEFAITLPRRHHDSTNTCESWLGIQTERRPDEQVIIITAIQEGVIKMHNRRAKTEGSQVVIDGDHIMAINGMTQFSEMQSVLDGVNSEDVTIDIIHAQDLAKRASRRFKITKPVLPAKWPTTLVRDSVGLYVVLANPVDVKDSVVASTAVPVVARLDGGQLIDVLEVKELSNIVRGRIEHPVSGWLTLLIKKASGDIRLAKPQSEGAYLFNNASVEDPWIFVKDETEPRRKQATKRIVDLVNAGGWKDDKKKGRLQVREMGKALAECGRLGVPNDDILDEQDSTLTLAKVKGLLEKEKQKQAKEHLAALFKSWNDNQRSKSEQEVYDLELALRECDDVGVPSSDTWRAKAILLDEEELVGIAHSGVAVASPELPKDVDFMVTATRCKGVEDWKALGFDIIVSPQAMVIKEIFKDVNRNGRPIYSIHAHNLEGKRKKEDKVMEKDIIVGVQTSAGEYLRWNAADEDEDESDPRPDPKRERNAIYKALRNDESLIIFFRRSEDRWSREEKAAAERSRPLSTPQDFGGDFMVIVPRPVVLKGDGKLGADINETTGEISNIDRNRTLPIYSWNKAAGRQKHEKVMEGDIIVAVGRHKQIHKWDTERELCLKILYNWDGGQFEEKLIVIKHPRDWKLMRTEKMAHKAKQGAIAKFHELKHFKFKQLLSPHRGKEDDHQGGGISRTPSFSSSSSSSNAESGDEDDGGLFRRVAV